MKIALIAPTSNLELTKQGDIHMALTHLALRDERYAGFYRNEKRFKILDNGAFEYSLHGIEDVIKAAKIIEADEIILPDILYDGEATIQSTQKAIEWLISNGLLHEYRLMAVPQGETVEQWWKCFDYMSTNPFINTIGLSKLSCPKAYKKSIAESRLSISKQLLFTANPFNHQYHLLGASSQVLYEVSRHPSLIRSIDTSAPFEFARTTGELPDDKRLEVKYSTNLEAKFPERCIDLANINAIKLLKKGVQHDHLS